MSKAIYLFKEHENFQVGKTKLNRRLVPKTGTLFIAIALLVSLAMFWLGVYALRQALWPQWIKTSGTWISCRVEEVDFNSTVNSIVLYEYIINETIYQSEENVFELDRCRLFDAERSTTVYYLSDNPQNGKLNLFRLQPITSLSFLIILGALGFFATYSLIIDDRAKELKYARLSHCDRIIEAVVLGVNSGKSSSFLRYSFFIDGVSQIINIVHCDKLLLEGSKAIQDGDILYILYLDAKTYCVL